VSAVATTPAEYAAPDLHLVTPTPEQLAEREMYRWMLWFGLPTLVAALFMSAVFATDQMWWVAGAIAGVIAAVGVLIWLAMSSCTNQA
jgi:hypothetical protein